MFEVGRMCVKLAGRDSGARCVIVDVLENQLVMIDGATRRRKVNTKHLEPLDEKVDIKKGASHEEVKKAFETLELQTRETKPKKAEARPRKVRKKKEKLVKKAKKSVKKGIKKEEPKVEAKEAKPESAEKSTKTEAKPEPKKETSPEDLKKALGGE